MSLIVNGIEIENVIYNGTELTELVFNGVKVWEKIQNIPIIFAVKRFQPGSGDEEANKSISFVVTAGAGGDAYAEYGGITKTIPAGTTVAINYGLYDGVDDGTPETGNITFSGYVDKIAGATWTPSGKGASATGYACVSNVVDWGSLKTIGSYLFSSSSLANVDLVLSNKIKVIEEDAFYAGSLNSITFTDTPVQIGNGAFSSSAIKSFTFPDWLTSIPYGLFENCSSLTTVIMPNTITDWAEGPLSMGAVSYGLTFSNCRALTSVTLSNKLKKIAEAAFMNCVTLPSITLHEGLEEISNNAFSGTALTTVTIPSTVNNIGINAFASTTALTSVVFKNTTGWVNTSGEAVDVSDPVANASLVRTGGLTRS